MITTRDLEYSHDNITYRGFLAVDETLSHRRPCVMIAHDWSGRNDFFCDKAQQLATKGYVGFAVDLYGNGSVGYTHEEKKALLDTVMSKRENVAQRFLLALNKALGLKTVDAKKVAAIGYCFGGLAVLDLARSGADVQGVVSFHGLLTPPTTPVTHPVRSKVLVLHGYDDPLVPPSQVQAFATEMTEKEVDWQIHMYGHTQHAFTNPSAADDQMGLRYNRTADLRSWASAVSFLEEVLD